VTGNWAFGVDEVLPSAPFLAIWTDTTTSVFPVFTIGIRINTFLIWTDVFTTESHCWIHTLPCPGTELLTSWTLINMSFTIGAFTEQVAILHGE